METDSAKPDVNRRGTDRGFNQALAHKGQRALKNALAIVSPVPRVYHTAWCALKGTKRGMPEFQLDMPFIDPQIKGFIVDPRIGLDENNPGYELMESLYERFKASKDPQTISNYIRVGNSQRERRGGNEPVYDTHDIWTAMGIRSANAIRTQAVKHRASNVAVFTHGFVGPVGAAGAITAHGDPKKFGDYPDGLNVLQHYDMQECEIIVLHCKNYSVVDIEFVKQPQIKESKKTDKK